MIKNFTSCLRENNAYPLLRESLEILQLNLGKMCNQVCKHCHVDAGPHRREIMSLETVNQCLEYAELNQIKSIDLTGGAPEMNPYFKYIVKKATEWGISVKDRCNLTILQANEKYKQLKYFLADHQVEIISSLPHYTSLRTDRQRGDGVFEKSIQSLKELNELGYGMYENDLQLNLVYNPTGAILPGKQEELEKEYKKQLFNRYGIHFNALFVITNMPISRFLTYLKKTKNYQDYMEQLFANFNPNSLSGLMCKNTLSVSWEGYLYDCDFNQMLEMNINHKKQHISELLEEQLAQVEINVANHCYGCTAGMGSSCGGQIA